MNEAAAQPSTATHDPAPADVVTNMNQAPAGPSTAGTASGPAVLRMRHFILIELALCAVGVARILAFRHSGYTEAFVILAVVGLFWVVVFARFEVKVEDGRLSFRDRFRPCRSLDLRQLVSVTAPGKPERWLTGRRFMVLTDRQGAELKLTLYGTRPSQRRRVLAALEPYVMADGVSRVGLVDEALSGELWWPHPRRRAASASRTA
jgi:hypothetical protein